jgi:DNA-directed RNA polymerase I subunit RPA1
VYSNDIGAILDTYGVEAARAAIVREIIAVFGVYGINIDTRHLLLIADHMTFDGGYRALNRTGMAQTPASPLLQMTFETTLAFLRTAALTGDFDALSAPSARLVLGLPVNLGTGSLQVRCPSL